MSLAWDTPVRFFPGNGEPGFRCTFQGCLALFLGMSPDERFVAHAEFEQPFSIDGRTHLNVMGARELETAAGLLKSRH